MIIYLIGFMGSGKTTLGKQLAENLNYKFIDQDSVIEEEYKITINDFFSKYGENAFREAENKILKTLSKSNNSVIATGGGAPCFLDNMEIMNKTGITVYLKIDPKTLCNRLRDAQSHRPLIKEKSEDELFTFVSGKLIERDDFYSRSKIILQSAYIKVQDILDALLHYKNL